MEMRVATRPTAVTRVPVPSVDAVRAAARDAWAPRIAAATTTAAAGGAPVDALGSRDG